MALSCCLALPSLLVNLLSKLGDPDFLLALLTQIANLRHFKVFALKVELLLRHDIVKLSLIELHSLLKHVQFVLLKSCLVFDSGYGKVLVDL